MISEFYKHFSVQVERIRNKAYVANFAALPVFATLTVCQQQHSLVITLKIRGSFKQKAVQAVPPLGSLGGSSSSLCEL